MATSTKPAKKPKPKRQPARAAETNGHAKPAAKNGAVHATQKTFDWERPEAMDSDVLYLTPSQFAPSGSNPRRNASQASIDELAQSIKEVGLVQPITVRPVNGKHEIVAGERRYHAAKRAGLRDIPVIVRDLDDQQAAVDADQLAERNLRGLEELFWTQQGAAEEFDDATVIEIAKCLSIDLAAAWKAKQMGPLTEAFFAAHSTEQLLDGVADGWGWKMSHLSSAEADLTTLKKWELVEWCIETAKSKPLPPCLELPRTGRGRRPKK